MKLKNCIMSHSVVHVRVDFTVLTPLIELSSQSPPPQCNHVIVSFQLDFLSDVT